MDEQRGRDGGEFCERKSSRDAGWNDHNGQRLGAANFAVGSGYWLRVPVFGWMTWAGECLEGNGVTPDIAVEADAESLSRGVDAQFEKALNAVSEM
jgi:C-terminal processing protease CtpA/Prc